MDERAAEQPIRDVGERNDEPDAGVAHAEPLARRIESPIGDERDGHDVVYDCLHPGDEA